MRYRELIQKFCIAPNRMSIPRWLPEKMLRHLVTLH